jgi:hypothetical protein
MDDHYHELETPSVCKHDDLIYYFVGDKEVLELINSNLSYTMNDESISDQIDKWFNEKNGERLGDLQRITFWDTTKITTMNYMFFQKKQFNELLLWNTKNVTNMCGMFDWTKKFNQPLEFNTEKVTNMSHMFRRASSFNHPLEFNTENVTNMSCMFDGASSFNQPLEFNMKNVTTMCWMFYNSGMEKMPWYSE